MTQATIKPSCATPCWTLSTAPPPGQSLQPGLLPDHLPEVPPYFKAEPSLIIKPSLKTASTVCLIILITLWPTSVRNQRNSHPPAPELRNCSRLGPVRIKFQLLPERSAWMVSSTGFQLSLSSCSSVLECQPGFTLYLEVLRDPTAGAWPSARCSASVDRRLHTVCPEQACRVLLLGVPACPRRRNQAAQDVK